MEIQVPPQAAYQLDEQFTGSRCENGPGTERPTAFGGINKWIMRASPRDIDITYEERRYEGFWHIACHSHYRYDRQRQFPLPVSGPHVYAVTVQGQVHTPVTGPHGTHIALEGVEHAVEDTRREVLLDAVTGQPKPFADYLTRPRQPIDLSTWKPREASVVQPEQRASTIVRDLLAQVIKPIDADAVHEEEVMVDNIDLYFRPIYAFEYTWHTKDKTAVIEFDGVTGDLRTDGETKRLPLNEMVNRDLLFDLGSEAINLVVPGGAIALRVVQHITAPKEGLPRNRGS